jgi:hypothetical protein
MTEKDETSASRSLLSAANPSVPSANGIMLSLYKLAEEAADLGLMSSNAAIRHAIEICDAEKLGAAPSLRQSRLN